MSVLRIWDEVSRTWINIPTIIGPPGPPGEVTEAELDKLSNGINSLVYSAFYPPVGREYYAKTIFSSGYISDTGVEGSNGKNARSTYFDATKISAIQIPLGYRVKFCWYASAAAAGFLQRDADFQQCGPGILNRVVPPEGAGFFRLVLVNNDVTDITAADRTELDASILFYSDEERKAQQTEQAELIRKVFNRQLAIGTANPSFTIVKGKMIGSSGADTSDSNYLRTAPVPASHGVFLLRCPEDYAINVDFFTGTTIGASYFVSKTRFRYVGDFYLVEKPENAGGFVVSLHRKDWAAAGDDDVTALTGGLKMFISSDRSYGPITQSDARAAFVTYMNQMCTKLGLSGTTYTNASGLNRDNVSCPADKLKLAIAVAGNPLASDIWSTKDRDFAIGGSNARTISVVNNVYSAEPAGALYKLLGGKGGTLTDTNYYRKARMGVYDVNGTAVAVALMGPGQWISSNMPDCTQELLGMMATELSGGTPSEGSKLQSLISNGGGYAAVPVPGTACAFLNSCTPAELLQRQHVLHNNESADQTPASTTKTMTLLCALSVATDLQEVITLVSGDVSITGSGSAFYAGDKLTLEEALRIMMMESSNKLAEAIGRVIGEKLLRAAEAKV